MSNCIDGLNILQVPSTHTQKGNASQPSIVRFPPIVSQSGQIQSNTNADAIEAINKLLNQSSNGDPDADPFSFNGSDITIFHLAGVV